MMIYLSFNTAFVVDLLCGNCFDENVCVHTLLEKCVHVIYLCTILHHCMVIVWHSIARDVITSDKGGGKCLCPCLSVCLFVCLSVC